jgi:hypothetical protein
VHAFWSNFAVSCVNERIDFFCFFFLGICSCFQDLGLEWLDALFDECSVYACSNKGENMVAFPYSCARFADERQSLIVQRKNQRFGCNG